MNTPRQWGATRAPWFLWFAMLSFLSLNAYADDLPASPPVVISGFVDGYYAWNDNRPASHKSFVPGTGTSAEHADELALNLVAIELVRPAKPIGFHLSLVAGDGADVVHAGEPGVERHHRIRNLYQASVSYSKQKLTLEAGVYPSHIGFEGFFSKDNWNYTRGWLGELSPFYQTGVKASYAWSDRWSGQLHVLQGWQLIHDNNRSKSVGTQIAYSGDRFGASLNTLIGPELANDNRDVRFFGDLVATYKLTPKLTIAGSLDRGRQQLPTDTNANWLGVAALGRYAFDERHAVAARVDRFRDPDAGISGTAQTMSSATVTYEFRAAKHVILKAEARHDHSTADVFDRHDGKSNQQNLAILGAVVTFGGQ